MNSIVEVLASYAASQPDVLFAADNAGNEYSYGQAWQKVRQAAAYLVDVWKIGQDDKVMVECNQDVPYLIADLACELIGAVFVPIENNASLDRKRDICQETHAKLWIAAGETLPFAETAAFAQMMGWEEEISRITFPQAGQVAEILYTTGTTGKSKGIVLTHGANVAVAENIRCGVQMKKDNTELIPVPVSHSHGLRCCYANLLNGGAVVLIDGLMQVGRLFDMVDRYHVTALDLSPSAAQLLIRVSKGAFWEYGRRMDYIQIGTAALPEQLKKQLVQELPGVRLYNFYGSTESGRSCVLEFSADTGKNNCIGKATRNAEIVFTDEDRNPVRATESRPGLLACRGKMNMLGYWQNPELTREILRNGFVFTNDLGYMDAEGYVFIFGRKDDVINYNGIKISPEEIEEAAVKYPGVRDAACVPQADAVSGQVPRLFITVEDESAFDIKDYRNYLACHLDGNKLPKRVEMIEAIPRTFNGKIKRKDLIGI